MSRYAEGTEVSADRSEAEIKRTLRRYGADDIVVGTSARLRQAFVQFHYRQLALELRIRLPDPDDAEFTRTPTGRPRRNRDQVVRKWEKACRQQWRVLLLLLKAQLEAVENELLEPWQAFLPWLRLPSGRTVGQDIADRINGYLASGTMPAGFLEAPG